LGETLFDLGIPFVNSLFLFFTDDVFEMADTFLLLQFIVESLKLVDKSLVRFCYRMFLFQNLNCLKQMILFMQYQICQYNGRWSRSAITTMYQHFRFLGHHEWTICLFRQQWICKPIASSAATHLAHAEAEVIAVSTNFTLQGFIDEMEDFDKFAWEDLLVWLVIYHITVVFEWFRVMIIDTIRNR
jgi:hypothetical protein